MHCCCYDYYSNTFFENLPCCQMPSQNLASQQPAFMLRLDNLCGVMDRVSCLKKPHPRDWVEIMWPIKLHIKLDVKKMLLMINIERSDREMLDR